MDVYVARQPIFDKHMNLFGYELLYRSSENNRYEGTDDDVSTASLIDTSFLVMGYDELIENTRGFINFSEKLLLRDVPRMLPRRTVVIEALERVRPTPEVLAALRRLRKDGYKLALDDFVFNEADPHNAELLEVADFVKLEFNASPIKKQMALLRKYKGRIRFLAEKVETAAEFKLAAKMGYELFQGYFFSRPVMLHTTDIGTLNVSLMQALNLLHGEETDFNGLAAIIQNDVGLTYKLLKMANAVYYGARYPITTVSQALLRLGSQELYNWIHLMIIKSVQNQENTELIKASIIRGRTMMRMSRELGEGLAECDFFIVGIFSSLDELLGRDMRSALEGLLLNAQVSAALLGEQNLMRVCLDAVLALERADWDRLSELLESIRLPKSKFMGTYMAALKWHRLFEDEAG